MGKIKWTEKKIEDMKAEGRGTGKLHSYLPWLDVAMVSSHGRSRRVWSPKTRRTHHLLSNVEYDLFLALEWCQDVVDIREQYPLDREVTQEQARLLGIRHPCYPGTNVPTVMTVDFLVTRVAAGKEYAEAFNAKRTEAAEDEPALAKLEIQRATLEALDVPHHLVFHSDIPDQMVRNIDWIRSGLVHDDEVGPFEGFWDTMQSKMVSFLSRADGKRTLDWCCSEFDTEAGVERGTGVRIAKILMHARQLVVDLALPDLLKTPVANLIPGRAASSLRLVGGR
jgi:hypothetical protein